MSHTELLKAKVVKSHDCAKFSRICAKFLKFERKTGKTGNIFMFWTHFDKVYSIFCTYLCAKF